MDQPTPCFVKWTENEEIINHYVLEHLSKALGLQFSVPRATSLDFTHNLHLTLSGKLEKIPQNVSLKIGMAFQAFTTPTLKRRIIIQEKVQGVDFCTFVKTKYGELTYTQKKEFITQLAEIATMDILMGFADRVLHISESGLGVSNLNNVMVQFDKRVKIYAIDNDPSQKFSTAQLERNKLTPHFQHPVTTLSALTTSIKATKSPTTLDL